MNSLYKSMTYAGQKEPKKVDKLAK
ncbi:uncharacterized protein METZ01_LOCUS93615 [marine metagenome]|uniref:Uncharacterized protein n=1 Tax=marine metagenome TaxID=408172 RepID=A0A381VL42_9ZZZZ